MRVVVMSVVDAGKIAFDAACDGEVVATNLLAGMVRHVTQDRELLCASCCGGINAVAQLVFWYDEVQIHAGAVCEACVAKYPSRQLRQFVAMSFGAPRYRM